MEIDNKSLIKINFNKILFLSFTSTSSSTQIAAFHKFYHFNLTRLYGYGYKWSNFKMQSVA